ncbi:MAG TPA: hypothetical protein DCL15_03870 [Chloroflexi bacterium]|nr:hypothetical protein [Chloroflexota bacterium]HHW86622.1 tetratricopeptide repeat-containing protein [Chloroflexota bacterium]
MGVQSIYEAGAMIEIARTLSALQQQLILSLRERGPGMLLEIAVRVLKFPDEVSGPLADLRAKRLVTSTEIAGGAFGNELFSLTPQGEQMAALLRDEAFLEQLRRTQEAPAPAAQAMPAPDPLHREAELLQSLGDVARQRGDLEKAALYYEQALEVTRRLMVLSAPDTFIRSGVAYA